ncbi:protein of unknown function duf814 [Anaeramoeba flamelloides]|uniref:NFACT RNA-binding domain-containing protein n=1 Tax=Anaeramoeba flamelloides TaxID=1746091 RepID=A0AAV7ZAF3_9EUKA|nr:protein of unknown function duf814 [Anaeramoeba flamelloides]|eukprot:Anaeramoba_flamelloidesa814734_66.p1 GENE.a814734_66~~a814734_66.p1  ORF type:complete len:209 (+),score=61.39 a814734_66:36-662(+)
MVWHYKVRGGYFVYSGKDKYENETLIKYHFPEDIWFHVKRLSSPHVYLRLRKGETMDDIPQETLDDICQITKYYSIEGKKKKFVAINYTPASNLLKQRGMEIGSVYYKNEGNVRTIQKVKEDRPTVLRLKKTRKEHFPDFEKMWLKRQKQESMEIKKQKLKEEKEIQKLKQKKKKEKEMKSYNWMMDEDLMESNQDSNDLEEYENNFF